ncbi:MAG TPA: Hpt domain-containing protein, partial [Longimicrobium sp.]|nr:Hpt domain-containing protein [Longimicrobium sp.]
MREGLAARLRAAFLDDLDEQLRAANAELLALEAHPADPAPLRALFRAAHTLKGAARAASLPAVEQLCHAMEELLARARDGRLALEPGHFAFLFAGADLLAATGERMRAGGEPEAEALVTLAEAVHAAELHDLPDFAVGSGTAGSGDRSSAPPPVTLEIADGADAAPSSVSLPTPVAPSPSPEREGMRPAAQTQPIASLSIPAPSIASPATAPSSPVQPTPIATAPERTDGRVRVEAEKLDALLASVEQLLLARARLETRLPEVEALGERAARAAAAAKRGNETAEPDAPAALAREADRVAEALRKEVRALGQVADALADGVRRTRMRPFAEAAEALPRAVRDVAAASGKEARLAVTGGAVEADRPVIDAFREALLHLVRNAVDHGIEPPDERERAGKPRQGRVRLSAYQAGGTVIVELQ